MNVPIYSNNPPESGYDINLNQHFILLLSDETVDKFNTKLTFAKHGIYIFVQYKERGYIVNSFPQDVFWNIIDSLYRLTHDCGNELLGLFLQVVYKDGFHEIKPFDVTDADKVQVLENATLFIKDVENMRISHFHNMKPDSEGDKARVKKVQAKLKEISGNELGPQDDTEWERCITWVFKNSEVIYEILNERLEFLQTVATQVQQNNLCVKYYGCLRDYFGRIMFDVIRDVLKKKRESTKDLIRIQSLSNTYKDEIVEKAVLMIQEATDRTDPYKAVIQAADIILTQKNVA